MAAVNAAGIALLTIYRQLVVQTKDSLAYLFPTEDHIQELHAGCVHLRQVVLLSLHRQPTVLRNGSGHAGQTRGTGMKP